MAILAQKLNLYSTATGGTEQANIYTTQAEMLPGKPNMSVTAGGINGFVQLDDVGAVNGTRGRAGQSWVAMVRHIRYVISRLCPTERRRIPRQERLRLQCLPT